jgi:hypothetical protein
MNRNKVFALLAMLVMTCLIFAQGPARDPKTGKFMKKSAMSSKMSKKTAFNAAHPRDPKTGKFVKKSAMASKMASHSKMSKMSKMKMTKKPSLMSKMKAMMHKKKA